MFELRKSETDEFYEHLIGGLEEDRKNVARQAAAGLLWTKQFYQYIVKDWLEGDQYEPTAARRAAGQEEITIGCRSTAGT